MACPPRPRREILLMLEERLREFESLDPCLQRALDSQRVLPTAVTHGLLDRFLTFGYFADETPCSRITFESRRAKAPADISRRGPL